MSSDITQVSDIISSDSDANAIQPLFAKAPPPAETPGGAVAVTEVIDWSRQARKKRN